jgi:uncharacterized protein (DUF983 family)
MPQRTEYFIVGAVVATIINLALGVGWVTWLVTSTVIIVAVVVGLMLLERHRGRPLRF